MVVVLSSTPRSMWLGLNAYHRHSNGCFKDDFIVGIQFQLIACSRLQPPLETRMLVCMIQSGRVHVDCVLEHAHAGQFVFVLHTPIWDDLGLSCTPPHGMIWVCLAHTRKG